MVTLSLWGIWVTLNTPTSRSKMFVGGLKGSRGSCVSEFAVIYFIVAVVYINIFVIIYAVSVVVFTLLLLLLMFLLLLLLLWLSLWLLLFLLLLLLLLFALLQLMLVLLISCGLVVAVRVSTLTGIEFNGSVGDGCDLGFVQPFKANS